MDRLQKALMFSSVLSLPKNGSTSLFRLIANYIKDPNSYKRKYFSFPILIFDLNQAYIIEKKKCVRFLFHNEVYDSYGLIVGIAGG